MRAPYWSLFSPHFHSLEWENGTYVKYCDLMKNHYITIQSKMEGYKLGTCIKLSMSMLDQEFSILTQMLIFHCKF
jgi:hypothetical protein